MKFNLSSGLIIIALEFIGVGAMFYWPNQKWIGLVFMALGLILLIIWLWPKSTKENSLAESKKNEITHDTDIVIAVKKIAELSNGGEFGNSMDDSIYMFKVMSGVLVRLRQNALEEKLRIWGTTQDDKYLWKEIPSNYWKGYQIESEHVNAGINSETKTERATFGTPGEVIPNQTIFKDLKVSKYQINELFNVKLSQLINT